jgi:hypothetical protein
MIAGVFSISDVRPAQKEPLLRIIGLAFVVLLVGCINVDNICPHKPITQGVFGEILDSSGKLEQNVEVDIFSMLNGMKDAMFGSAETSRGGYQFRADPSDYFVCAKTVCATVTVPTGIVELSATDDATAGLTWNAPVAVPPAQAIGPCKFGE